MEPCLSHLEHTFGLIWNLRSLELARGGISCALAGVEVAGHLDYTGYLINVMCLSEDFHVIGGASLGEWAQHISISVS